MQNIGQPRSIAVKKKKKWKPSILLFTGLHNDIERSSHIPAALVLWLQKYGIQEKQNQASVAQYMHLDCWIVLL